MDALFLLLERLWTMGAPLRLIQGEGDGIVGIEQSDEFDDSILVFSLIVSLSPLGNGRCRYTLRHFDSQPTTLPRFTYETADLDDLISTMRDRRLLPAVH